MHLQEIVSYIELHRLQLLAEGKKPELNKLSLQQETAKERQVRYDDPPNSLAIERILKRFAMINPAMLQQTIKSCEAQGLVSVS